TPSTDSNRQPICCVPSLPVSRGENVAPSQAMGLDRPMIRDRLLAGLAAMGATADYARLAVEVLGIRGASPALARRLIEQALVVEDRREHWRRVGERVRREAPPLPGVYIFRDGDGRA